MDAAPLRSHPAVRPVLLAAALLGLGLAVAAWIGGGSWPSQVMAGLALVLAAGHAAAWRLYPRRPQLAIQLAVSAQLAALVALPLAVADIWLPGLIGVTLLALEASLVAPLNRLPSIMVMVVLGGAAMLAVDLLAPADRLGLLAATPALVSGIGLAI
ncbi:MAG TPA: hypothetical protein VGE07_00260, partial [Herpetosiphonaceae bacterium]